MTCFMYSSPFGTFFLYINNHSTCLMYCQL
nr:MAG TPA: hypothetical protein [Caudoviricetes sp.]